MKSYTPDKNDFFKGIVQSENKEYDVKMPIFYYDSMAMSAICTASTRQVRMLLPLPDMHPVEAFPGRCLVAFSAFEYRRTDIGPYNEFSISALISYGRRPVPGISPLLSLLKNRFTAHIIHLPVTSERARRGGVETCGYPKFLADIAFAQEGGYTACTVAENGERILTLRGRNPRTSPGRLTKYVIHTVLDGIPLRANLYLNPIRHRQTIGLGAAKLDIGNGHRICDELRGIKLSRMPVLYQYTPSYEAILCNSRNLIDD